MTWPDNVEFHKFTSHRCEDLRMESCAILSLGCKIVCGGQPERISSWGNLILLYQILHIYNYIYIYTYVYCMYTWLCMIMIICSLGGPCLSCFIKSRNRILFDLTTVTILDQVSQCFCQNSSCAKCVWPPANQPSHDQPGMQSCRTVHLNPLIFKSKVKCGTTHATGVFFHRPAALLPSIYRMQWLDLVEPWPLRTSAFCLCNFIRDAPETLLTRCAKAKRWICKSPVVQQKGKFRATAKSSNDWMVDIPPG